MEFLPYRYAFLTTLLACWWGIGYVITGFLAWGFMSNYSCLSAADCDSYSGNMGWRLNHFVSGGIVLIVALIRVLLFKMEQSPKWLVTQNRDEEAVEVLRSIAEKNNRPFNLTVDDLLKEGQTLGHLDNKGQSLSRNIANLFSTPKQTYATSMLFLLWVLIGIVSVSHIAKRHS